MKSRPKRASLTPNACEERSCAPSASPRSPCGATRGAGLTEFVFAGTCAQPSHAWLPMSDTKGPHGGRTLQDERAPTQCRSPLLLTFLQERQQVLVDLVLVGIGQAVRRARVDNQPGALDQLCRLAAGDIDRHDLVVVTVDHQRWHIELLQVRAEVGGRERSDRIVGVLVAALHALRPPRIDQPLRHLRARAVEAIERARRNVLVQLGAVLHLCLADAIEHFDRQAVGVVGGLQHERRHRADQHGLLHSPGAMPADVARHLAATGREPTRVTSCRSSVLITVARSSA